MNKNYRLSQSYSGNIGEEDQSPNLQRYHTNGSRYSSIQDNAFNASRRDSLRSMSYQSTIESAELPYEPEATPLPKMQMFVVFLILVSEPLTSTVLFPFIYFMVKDLLSTGDEKEIGTYAGLITSMFFVAQFFTAISWGKVSDRIGRRPVLLIGLIGNTISSCLFGLSKSLWWAMASRALCGTMNGNGGVARSLVSEITDRTNKAKAFSIFGFCWGAGLIGPALGGYLSRPAEQFPGIFGNCVFLKEYPYFLPCFISACGSFVGFLTGYFYLEESNPRVLAEKRQSSQHEGEATSLLKSTSTLQRTNSLFMITKVSYIVILSYVVFGFHSMVFDEVLPLYFLAPSHAGGLGIRSADFAKALSIFGINQLFIQFVIYPRLSTRFDTLTLLRVAYFAFIPVYFLFPELTTVLKSMAQGSPYGEHGWALTYAYYFLLFIRFFGNSIAFTCIGVLVS
ncbi:major facilitator superfamily domain-containing protein [Choanephora cucurbitarum]|nr:major facilitator superfamily domain-containing protein [Choanephora cucurbitarum]